MTIRRKQLLATALGVVVLVVASASAALASPATRHLSASARCGKFSGTVLLTYSNPQTIILHVIRGKVNAATTFTMTPSTTYSRNGAPATFSDVAIGDTGTITAQEQLPSGALLACTVSVSGP